MPSRGINGWKHFIFLVNISKLVSKKFESVCIPFHWMRRYPFPYIPVENEHVLISDSVIGEKIIGHTHTFAPFS